MSGEGIERNGRKEEVVIGFSHDDKNAMEGWHSPLYGESKDVC